jgi:N-acetylglucosamine malate deacetylase 1
MPSLLALTAHPDDAEVAIGGTLARCARTGWQVTVAVFTASSDRIRKAAQASADILGHRLAWVDGGARPWVEDFKDTELVAAADALVGVHQPDVIISHWRGDVHRDHVRLAQAAYATLRRTPATLYAQAPSEFRSPAYDEFPANTYVDISDDLPLKERALGEFQYEGWAWQQVETPTMTALSRAMGARFGWQAAEGLLLVRQLGLGAPGLG